MTSYRWKDNSPKNMQPQILIETQGLGKCYRVYGRPLDHLKEVLSLGRKQLFREFWALRNVSFEVHRGESWGIVGENGAGKSTLLKLLCGVTLPSEGKVEVRGRIGALLELGVGFHPEYTGRENLYLSGALMGLRPEELRERIPFIADFAAVGEFLDRPLKTYSTGMMLRLAFALAISVEPEVLVTDEVLAVGDEAFQKKCIRWMESFLAGGGTLIFCAHNSYQVKKLCGKALWLQGGRIRALGASHSVVQEYLEYLEQKEKEGESEEQLQASLQAGENRVREVRLQNGRVQETREFGMGECLRVEVTVEAGVGEEKPPVVHIGLVRADGVPIYGVSTDMDGVTPKPLGLRLYRICYEIPRLDLLPGKYLLRVHSLDGAGLRLFDTVEREILVRGETRELGLCRLPHHWHT